MKNLDLGNLYDYTEEMFGMIESDVIGKIAFDEPLAKHLSDNPSRTSIRGFEEDARIEVYNTYYCASKNTVSKFINTINDLASCEMVNKDKNCYYFNDSEYSNIKLCLSILNSGSDYAITLSINWYPVSYKNAYNIEKSGYCIRDHCIEKDSDGSIKNFKIKGGNVKWKK